MWSCDCVGEVSVHAVGGHLPVAGPGRVGQDGVSGDACLRVQVLQEIALCAEQGVAPHVLARRPVVGDRRPAASGSVVGGRQGDDPADLGAVLLGLPRHQPPDEGYRRMTGAQLNRGSPPARPVDSFSGIEANCASTTARVWRTNSAPALNSVVLFNSLYVDAAVKQVAADGFPVTDELLARLSPPFTRPAAPGLRQLRDDSYATRTRTKTMTTAGRNGRRESARR